MAGGRHKSLTILHVHRHTRIPTRTHAMQPVATPKDDKGIAVCGKNEGEKAPDLL